MSYKPRARTAATFALCGSLLGLTAPTALAAEGVAAQDTAAQPVLQSAAVERLSGADRYATAAEIALAAYPTGSDAVVLASGTAFADALAASALAGQLGAPVLLTASDGPTDATLAAVRALGPERVVVVGGRSRVPDSVAERVTAAAGASVSFSRIAGDDRYVTAAGVAEELDGVPQVAGKGTVFLATGENFPDALAAGPVAAAAGIPLLLATKNSVPAATERILKSGQVQHVVLLGGTGTLSDAVTASLTGWGLSYERLGGTTRTGTAVAVADWARQQRLLTPGAVTIARGDNGGQGFDALAMAAYAGKAAAPLLLTSAPGNLSTETASWLIAHRAEVTSVTVAGGVNTVTDASVAMVNRHLQGLAAEGTCPQGCSLVEWDHWTGDAQQEQPTTATDLTNVTSVTENSWGTLVSRLDGSVWYRDLVGCTDERYQYTTVQVPTLSNIVRVDGTRGFEGAPGNALALDSQGRLWSWAWLETTPADCGGNSVVQRVAPGPLTLVAENVVDFTSRYLSGAAVLADGSVRSWDLAEDGTPEFYDEPLTGAVDIAGNGDAWLVRDSAGAVRRWGYDLQPDADYQQGWITASDALTERLPSPAVGIATSWLTAGALLSDGRVATWGTGDAPLARPAGTDPLTPAVVPGLTGITQFTLGQGHGIAASANGTVWDWSNGVCDTDGTCTYPAPEAVHGFPTGKQVLALSASYDAKAALVR